MPDSNDIDFLKVTPSFILRDSKLLVTKGHKTFTTTSVHGRMTATVAIVSEH